MTLKTSSDSRIFRHDLSCVLRRNLGFIIAGTIVFLVLIPFATAGIPDNSIFNIATTHDQMMFRFINQSYTAPVWFCVLAYGSLLGISSFYFLLDKKQTTFCFSIGLRRRSIFIARALTGVIGILCAVVIPMAFSYFLNRAALGTYEGMTASCIYITACLITAGLVSFMIAAVSCSLAGVLSEALMYNILLLGGMAGILYCVNKILLHLVWGNAFGVVFYSGTKGASGSLPEVTSFADPLLFFLNDTSEYSMYYRGFTTTAPASFSLGKLFVWLAVLGGLTLLACLCVIKRKAEQAGISGRCHTMTYILVTVTEFCSFTLVYTSFDTSSRLLAFCMAALSGILVYGIWNTAFLHTSGGRIKVLVKAFLQIAAGAFVFIVIAAGGSIVKGILPSTEKVTEAAVVYVGNPSYICGETSGSSTGNSYYMVSNFTFSERADIDRVLKLHTELKQMGMLKKESSETDFSATVVPYDIQISYTMSDGSVKTWYYDRASLAILEQMLEEEESDDMQEAMRTVITGGDTGDTTNRAAKAYASGDIYLSNTWYTKPYRISLSDDLRNELRNALADDIIDQTVSERYFPGEDAIGVILFSANGESDIKSFSWNLGNALIYVTKDYTNTIAFLEKHDIISCFDFDGEIESITLQKYDPYGGINGRKKPLSNFFIGYKSDSIDDFIVQVDFGAKQPITDETRLAKLIPRLRSTYNMTEEGYLAAVKLKGSNQYIYKYLPGTVSLTQ